jgi:hypothetical protein
MKTTILLSLTTFLVLSHNLLFAVNPTTTREKITLTNGDISITVIIDMNQQLGPIAPFEATFDDSTGPDAEIPGKVLKEMAPTAPKEASFDDEPTTSLAPTAPRQASFEDFTGK